mmetsp:Transcript_81427/g.217788  ORF Transcript_81427/g.217788 Transcript_81427/m.217788 type:complete len:324 (-) Transcript_81427:82-1053(-)
MLLIRSRTIRLQISQKALISRKSLLCLFKVLLGIIFVNLGIGQSGGLVVDLPCLRGNLRFFGCLELIESLLLADLHVSSALVVRLHAFLHLLQNSKNLTGSSVVRLVSSWCLVQRCGGGHELRPRNHFPQDLGLASNLSKVTIQIQAVDDARVVLVENSVVLVCNVSGNCFYLQQRRSISTKILLQGCNCVGQLLNCLHCFFVSGGIFPVRFLTHFSGLLQHVLVGFAVGFSLLEFRLQLCNCGRVLIDGSSQRSDIFGGFLNAVLLILTVSVAPALHFFIQLFVFCPFLLHFLLHILQHCNHLLHGTWSRFDRARGQRHQDR